jgi:hypothetical protein
LRLQGIDSATEDYAKWLIMNGDGTAATESNENYDDLVKLHAGICLNGNIEDLKDWVFPDI